MSMILRSSHGNITVSVPSGEILSILLFEGADPDAFQNIYRFDVEQFFLDFPDQRNASEADIIRFGYWHKVVTKVVKEETAYEWAVKPEACS